VINAWVNAFASEWAEAMWRAIWQGSIVILAVAGLATLTSRILRPAVRCWLWRIAFLKLAFALLWVNPIRLPVLPNASTAQPSPVELSASARRFELHPSPAASVERESLSLTKADLSARGANSAMKRLSGPVVAFAPVDSRRSSLLAENPQAVAPRPPARCDCP